MSGIGVSGVSGQSSINPLWQWLQSQNVQQSQSVGATDTDGDSDGSGGTQSTQGPTASSTSGTRTGATSLAQQLETAIQNALNGVSTSQTSNPQDVLTSIEQAIQTTLQNNGISPSQLSQTGGHHPHHGGGGESGSASALLAATSPGGSTGSGSTGSDGTGSSSNTSQTPGLDALLGQLNVDPQQFQSDIASAISGSQNGQLDFSLVFQNFPVGQNVNTLA